MNKIIDIVSSWGRVINASDEWIDIAATRLSICNDCDSKKTALGISYCNECGCPLKSKVFSKYPKPCPLNKWPHDYNS